MVYARFGSIWCHDVASGCLQLAAAKEERRARDGGCGLFERFGVVGVVVRDVREMWGIARGVLVAGLVVGLLWEVSASDGFKRAAGTVVRFGGSPRCK